LSLGKGFGITEVGKVFVVYEYFHRGCKGTSRVMLSEF